MKKKKLTKTYAECGNELLLHLKAHIEDAYFMNVVYYYVRRALIKYDFDLGDLEVIVFNGRHLGYKYELPLPPQNYNTILKALGLTMSLRAIMLNKNYIKNCYNDNLLFYDLDSGVISWNSHRAIMECIDDEDFRQIYQMVLEYKSQYYLSDEQKSLFDERTIRPEYRNADKYFKSIANDPDYDGQSVIKNNEFLRADFEEYEIPEKVEYVGDTAFAYCKNLETLIFTRKVLFGHFPIIECDKLRQIIVPTEYIDYYKEKLHYYENIITDHELEIVEEVAETKDEPVDQKVEVAESEIEHIYVGIPSADPYTEIELEEPVQETPVVVEPQEESKPIDEKILQTVFDKKATSYKYFWLMAIISLVKEKHHLAISYDDITIRMAAMAWPIVFEDDIDLGNNDLMKNHLEGVVKKTKLIKGATSNVVENYLQQHYSSQGVDKILSPLMKNVPYRFLSPWIKYTTDEEVIEKSRSKSFNGLYALYPKYIVLDEEWWDYINEHYWEVCDFSLRSFVTYLKKYNSDIKLVKLMTTGWSFVKY